jgi:hypothetical protein
MLIGLDGLPDCHFKYLSTTFSASIWFLEESSLLLQGLDLHTKEGTVIGDRRWELPVQFQGDQPMHPAPV